MIASAVMVGLYHADQVSLGLVVSTLTGAAFVLLARWRGWQLPDPYSSRPSQSLSEVQPRWLAHPRRNTGARPDTEEPP